MQGEPARSGNGLAVAVRLLAAEQYGAVSRRQLLDLGATRSWISTRLRTQRWQRPFPGVYVLFTGPIPFRTLVSAALLRCGRGALACGLTAAALDGMTDEPAVVHVLVPADRRLTVERPIQLRRTRLAGQLAHPSRTPARTRIEETVLDLCEQSTRAEDVAAWVSRAVGRRLTTPARLQLALRARSRYRWRALVTGMLADVGLGAHSPLELEYLRSVERAHRLPAGIRQHRVEGRSARWVDVDVPELMVRIELDGRLGHVDDGAFRDRRRDNAATRAGRSTLRYGWGEVFGSPCAVAAEVSTVLRAQGWTGRPALCGPDCPVGRDRGGLGSQ